MPRSTDAPPSAVAGRASPGLGVLVVGFSLRWFGFSFYGFFVLLLLHSSFGLTFAEAGLDVAAVALVALPFSQLGGGLSDRWGRRGVVVLSLAGEAGGLALVAWGISVDSLAVVLGALAVSRALAALGFPATIAYVRDSTDSATRTAGLSWLRVGGNLGAVGGVALAGVLLAFVGYGPLTALAALLIGAVAGANAVWLRPTERDRSLPASAGVGRSAAGRPTRALPKIGRSLYSTFEPLWADRDLLLTVLAIALIYLLNLQVGYAIPTFGLEVLGIPYPVLGALLAFNGLVPALGQVPLTRALAGRRLTVAGVWGTALYAVSFLVLGVDGEARAAVVAVFALVVIVASLAENLCFLPVYTLPVNLAPETSRGVYAGASLSAAGVGGVFAPLLAGVALTFSSHPVVTWAILAAPAVPAMVILRRLGSRLPGGQDRI